MAASFEMITVDLLTTDGDIIGAGTTEVTVTNVAPDFDLGAGQALTAILIGQFNLPGITITDPGADTSDGNRRLRRRHR